MVPILCGTLLEQVDLLQEQRDVAAKMMDHIIRLEESKDRLRLDLQFTASIVRRPFLHERDNWAAVTESEIGV